MVRWSTMLGRWWGQLWGRGVPFGRQHFARSRRPVEEKSGAPNHGREASGWLSWRVVAAVEPSTQACCLPLLLGPSTYSGLQPFIKTFSPAPQSFFVLFMRILRDRQKGTEEVRSTQLLILTSGYPSWTWQGWKCDKSGIECQMSGHR